MLVEIALMDFFAFGRSFSVLQVAAILVVFASVVSIQTRRSAKKA